MLVNASYPDDGVVVDPELLLSRVARTLHQPADRMTILRTHYRRGNELVLELEVESRTAPRPSCACIAKLFNDGRGQPIWLVNRRLWAAEMRPPDAYTIARPLAYGRRDRVFVQEKAPGVTLWRLLFEPGEIEPIPAPARAVAFWLSKFQKLELSRLLPDVTLSRRISRQANELATHDAGLRNRLSACVNAMIQRLREPSLAPPVVSHGDFHPKNIYLHPGGRVTVIDLETVKWREREADIGYLLGQLAGMGELQLGSFHATLPLRACFLETCERLDPAICRRRVALHVAIWFVQNLHYQLCAMRNGKDDIAHTWLANAAKCLLQDEPLSLQELG